MAYLHKVEMYVVDSGEEVEDKRALSELLNNDDYIPFCTITDFQTREFEWDDNVPINKIDATPEVFDEFWGNCVTDTKQWYNVTFNDDGRKVEEVWYFPEGKVCGEKVWCIDRDPKVYKASVYTDNKTKAIEKAAYLVKDYKVNEAVKNANAVCEEIIKQCNSKV